LISSVVNINSLSRIHQQAQHELYLSRHDSQFVVSQETINFLDQNQSLLREVFHLDYEREHHIFDSYTQITDSDRITRLYISEPSSTPPYCQSYSDSEDEVRDLPKTKIFPSASSISNSDSQVEEEEDSINHHKIRTGVTTLHKSPKQRSSPLQHSHSQYNFNSEMSDTSDHDKTHSGEDQDQDYPEYESEEGEVSQQIGLNGKPITSCPSGSNIYMSSRPKIRLDMSIPIDHQLVKRFVSQIRNEDFTIEIEN
jgi:hypothetical protein